MRLYVIVSLFAAAVTAVPAPDSRIAGGALATINQYPFVAAALYSPTGSGTFSQACAGSIINNRSILSSASCYVNQPINRWRIRVGSSYPNSGGSTHNVNAIIIYASYNATRRENDIALVRSATYFTLSNTVATISIANTGYSLPDNSVVWAFGWGRTGINAAAATQLRAAQVWTVNANVCRNNYAALRFNVTDNMICSGWVNVGGRGQCEGDNGGPLVHYGAQTALVGVSSWGQCGSSYYPDINTRVSNYANWVRTNA